MKPTVLSRAMAAVGVAMILSTTAVFAADDLVMDPDGVLPFVEDSSAPSRNLGDVCLNTAAGGSVLLAAINGSGQTWNNGATVTVSSGGATGTHAADVTVGVGADSTIVLPSNWNSLGANELSSDTAVGTFTVMSSVLGAHDANAKWNGTGAGGAGTQTTPNLHLTWNVIPCVSNTAPTVAFDANQPGTAVEGDTKSFAFTITDTEGGVMSFATGYPDCGTGNAVSDASISATGGSFKCTFADGPSSPSVKVKVVDSGNLASNEASTPVTVSNALPVVDAPSFDSTLVCQGTSVNLTGISFSDAGVVDYPWSLTIDWGDGTSDYEDTNVGAQGAYASQSHTYAPGGPYTATVTVDDKDGGEGSDTSSNTVTVVAHYSLTFLQPVDGTTTGAVANSVKLGRVVPVKVLVRDNCANDFAGAWVTDPATAVRIRAGLAPTSNGMLLDSVEAYADAGQSNSNTLYFRWTSDIAAPGGGFWIYNLDTKNFQQTQFVSGQTYRIDATVGGVLASGNQYALLKMVK